MSRKNLSTFQAEDHTKYQVNLLNVNRCVGTQKNKLNDQLIKLCKHIQYNMFASGKNCIRKCSTCLDYFKEPINFGIYMFLIATTISRYEMIREGQRVVVDFFFWQLIFIKMFKYRENLVYIQKKEGNEEYTADFDIMKSMTISPIKARFFPFPVQVPGYRERRERTAMFQMEQ